MTALKLLIVDDERPARQKLRRLVSADPAVGAVLEAADAPSAVELIRAESPDVVLLDVEMPGMDGFGVLEALAPEERPHVVFVTAYDQYAVRAFDAHAVDYVLKPFDAERLARALDRARAAAAGRHDREARRRLERALAEVRSERPERLERLLVESDGRARLLPLGEVERFESAKNYVVVHTAGERYRLRTTLERLEERLDPAEFVRVHRSTIVRVDCVAELQPWTHGDYVVLLHGGARVRLSRRYRDRLERFLP